KAYTGMVLAEEAPKFATNVPIENIANPVWNAAENSWDGDNIQQMFDDIQATIEDGDSESTTELLAELNDNFKSFQKTTMTTLSSVTDNLAQITKRVDSLEKGGD